MRSCDYHAQSVVEVIDNVLDVNNEAGWQSFAQVSKASSNDQDTHHIWSLLKQNEEGSQRLLDNAERYGQYFAQALQNENVTVSESVAETMAVVRENIGEWIECWRSCL